MARQNQNRHILIAVIGVTGAGKTTFISRASGRTDLKIGHDIDSCTQDVIPVTFTLDNRTVTLIDTPGFDDSDRSDADILALVANYMAQSYEEGRLLTGVIFVQPINQARLQGSEARRNRLFKKILGEDAYMRVVIATTMWNRVPEGEAAARVDQRSNRKDVWGDMVQRGARVERHDDNAASATAIIRKLMRFDSPVELQLQRELLQTGGKVVLTSAGKQLDEDLGAVISKLRREIEELKSERTNTSREVRELRQKISKYEEEKRVVEDADVCGGSCLMM